MSVTVGVEARGGVWMAADSLISEDNEAYSIEGKVFEFDGVGYGVTGDLRVGQLLKYNRSEEYESPDKYEDPLEWIVTVLVPELRKLTAEHQVWEWTKKSERGVSILVALRGQLFYVQGDWSVYRAVVGYMAAGSGSSVALGSLHTSKDYEEDAEERCRAAVEAAAYHVPSVAEPIHTIFIEE